MTVTELLVVKWCERPHLVLAASRSIDAEGVSTGGSPTTKTRPKFMSTVQEARCFSREKSGTRGVNFSLWNYWSRCTGPVSWPLCCDQRYKPWLHWHTTTSQQRKTTFDTIKTPRTTHVSRTHVINYFSTINAWNLHVNISPNMVDNST